MIYDKLISIARAKSNNQEYSSSSVCDCLGNYYDELQSVVVYYTNGLYVGANRAEPEAGVHAMRTIWQTTHPLI